MRANGTANSEEPTEVENEPEVKQNVEKKKKRKRSLKDKQDSTEKEAPITPKTTKNRSTGKLDINGNSEDDTLGNKSGARTNGDLHEMVSDKVTAQGNNSISEMIVEKTLKELRNQVSPAQDTENTPVKKKKKKEIKGDETPFAAFTKTTTPPAFFKKAVSRTEPRKAKTTKVLNMCHLYKIPSENLLTTQHPADHLPTPY